MKDKSEITPEMTGILAEKGLRGLRLSRKQKQTLLASGLEEIYELHDLQKKAIPPLEDAEIDMLMERFFSRPVRQAEEEKKGIWVRLLEKTVEFIDCGPGWTQGSPAFAVRGESKPLSVSMYRETGRLNMHLELIMRADRLADIRVCLTDNSGRDKTSFEAELLKNERCIESMTAKAGECFTMSSIEAGEYTIRVSDMHGEINSFQLRMD